MPKPLTAELIKSAGDRRVGILNGLSWLSPVEGAGGGVGAGLLIDSCVEGALV